MNLYKPSEKVQTLSAPAKDLGPEFRQGEIAHEIDRYRAILRNPKATAEDKRVAQERLNEFAVADYAVNLWQQVRA
jgi:hypothetical protein